MLEHNPNLVLQSHEKVIVNPSDATEFAIVPADQDIYAPEGYTESEAGKIAFVDGDLGESLAAMEKAESAFHEVTDKKEEDRQKVRAEKIAAVEAAGAAGDTAALAVAIVDLHGGGANK